MAISIPTIIMVFLPILSDNQPKKTNKGVAIKREVAIRESTCAESKFITFCIKDIA